MSRYLVAVNATGVGNIYGGQFSFAGTLVDEDYWDWAPPVTNYYKRSDVTVQDPAGYFSLWTASGFMTPDPSAVSVAPTVVPNWLNRFSSFGLDGDNGQKFIIGTTKDSSLSALASVGVEAYLTSSDVKAGSTISQSDGYYEVGTPYAGVAHYVTGYLPGSPDVAGTSVNTLVPTNRDGT